MGTIVYLEDIRLARSAPRVPAFSNFWIEISLAVLNGWLQASIRHLPPPCQVIPFAQPPIPARRAL